ncbi:MAG: hypothetical protein J0I32_15115 [Sphingobacteriales bacterium]|nr:hypothetical protein [Sphingobacteriales bacterium]
MKHFSALSLFLALSCAATAQSWNVTGNSGTTSSNFVGNTDSVALIFRTNNLERARVTSNGGNLLLGTTMNSGYKLDIVGNLRSSMDAQFNGILVGKGPGTATNTVAIGNGVLVNNTTGTRNVAMGVNALRYNQTGFNNTAIGAEAMGGNAADSAISGSVGIGNLSRVSGVYGVAIGSGAWAGLFSIAIGSPSTASVQSSIAIGRYSEASGFVGTTAIGIEAKATHSGGIVIGHGLQTTGSYQLLIGNRLAGAGIRDVYIGGGVTQQLASTYGPLTIQPTGQTGTNQTGQTIRIATGKGTGTGTSGDIHFMTSVPRSSGDTLQSIATAMILKGSTGNVGIGTIKVADTAYKLFVEKGIRTRKVKVDISSWPDYVFDEQYKLQDLAELEMYVRKNKHLPEVPSAQEVEREGVNLGDNQAILLKKIEELTLHLIEMNQRVIEMDKRVQQLESENKILKEEIKKSDK